ncbi:MAG TPA: glycosyl hydrolase family 18 protein, partial [Phycisphaerae bacterium]|nr:glycosyl hydrolase family 18 protein [Phycisphaerae bacterium]
INSHGDVTNTHGWPWTSTVNTAHANGVKVHLVVTLFDGASINTLIGSTTYKNNFFNNMKNLMIAGNADGINIDFESGTGWQPQMDEFMGELSAYMDANIPGGSETSIATAPINWTNWQFDNLVQNCDIIFIMGYAFYGSWSSTSGPCSPLTGGGNNITSSVVTQYASARAIAPEKIVLGIPYYGGHWTTTGSSAYSSVIDWIGSTRFANDQPNSLNYGLQWDSASQTPWYRYQSGGVWHQIWFDNADSLRLKYQLAEQYDLGGVGMWALNYDGTLPDLWNVIDEEFVAPCCTEAPLDDVIFADNFDDGGAAGRWNVFGSSADHTVDFNYDYSADGIPPAPNSAGTTRGVKLTVNSTDANPSTEVVNIYPKGVYGTVDFDLKFDAWLNYNGGAGGATGSTKHMIMGVGHAGGQEVWTGNPTSDGKWFAVTGEGGSTVDYRAHSGPNTYTLAHGVYLAGSTDNTATFYQDLFPAPTYETSGAPGKHWVEVEVHKRDTLVDWVIDGTTVVTSPSSGVSGNVMIGLEDLYGTLAVPLADSYLVIDNVRVEQLGELDCNANNVADGCETMAAGDFDADGDVDLADLAALADCLQGPNATPRPTRAQCTAACQQAFDMDGDYDVDLKDVHALLGNFAN